MLVISIFMFQQQPDTLPETDDSLHNVLVSKYFELIFVKFWLEIS